MSDQPKSLYLQLAESVGPLARLPNNGAVYHTGEQIVTHLNRVLGPAAWSFRVLAIGEEPDSDECWAFGEITAIIDGVTVVKQDYGSQAFKRSRSTGKYVSKWDDKKSAATDALKRCARLLGVGLDAWANERAPSWRPEEHDDPPAPAPDEKATCDVAFFNRRWHAAVKGTRFTDEETRHKFVAWHTANRFESLTDFLAQATTDEATALISAIEKQIAHEARKAGAG